MVQTHVSNQQPQTQLRNESEKHLITQMDFARAGIVTEQMKHVAQHENLDPDVITQRG